MRRFFIEGPLTSIISITGGDARHIARVLRLQPGSEIIVNFADGQAAVAIIGVAAAELVRAEVKEIVDHRYEPPVEVWLAQGLPKSDKMDYIVQKAVELGAVGIIPMNTAFSVVHYDAVKASAKVARWQKIAREAAKQCGRNYVPSVEPVQTLDDVLTAADGAKIIMLFEGKTTVSLKEVLQPCQAAKYLLLIGPEGGFSPEEAELCARHGCSIAGLGPRILRTETAALAALTATMYDKGGLG